jgi:molecular chaperone HtpG
VGESLSKVRLSRKLSTQACCLTTEGPVTLEMERFFRRGPSEEMRKVRAARVLELNPEHRAFAALQEAYQNDRERAKKLSCILASLAELSAGVEVEDPAQFAEQVAELC